MTDDEREAYEHALRVTLAERRALWAILQDFIGQNAKTAGDPAKALGDMASRVSDRLNRKDDDAEAKGLQLPLGYVKTAVDRFFAELAQRLEKGDL